MATLEQYRTMTPIERMRLPAEERQRHLAAIYAETQGIPAKPPPMAPQPQAQKPSPIPVRPQTSPSLPQEPAKASGKQPLITQRTPFIGRPLQSYLETVKSEKFPFENVLKNLHQTIEESGGFGNFVTETLQNAPQDAKNLVLGLAAVGAGAQNLAVTVPTALTSVVGRKVTGVSVAPKAEQRLRDIVTTTKQVAPAIAESLEQQMVDYIEDPVGTFKRQPITTTLDLASMIDMMGGGASLLSKGAKAVGAAKLGKGLDITAKGIKEVARATTPLGFAQNVTKGGATLARQLPVIDKFVVSRNIMRDVTNAVVDYTKQGRVMDWHAVRQAMQDFQGLTPEEKLAIIPIMEGRANPVPEMSDAMRAALTAMDQNEGLRRDIFLALNLLSRKQLGDAPWIPLMRATNSETPSEVVAKFGLTDSEVLPRRTRLGDVSKGARSVRTPILNDDMSVSGHAVTMTSPEVKMVSPIYVPITTEHEIRASGFLREFVKHRIPDYLRAKTPAASVMREQAAGAVAGERGMLGESRVARSVREAGVAEQPTAFDEVAAQVNPVSTQMEAQAGGILETAAPSRLTALRAEVPLGEVSASGTMSDPSFLKRRTGARVFSEKRVQDPQIVMLNHLREQGELVRKLRLTNHITENYGYKLDPVIDNKGAFQVIAPTGQKQIDRVFGSRAEAEKFLTQELEFDGHMFRGRLWRPTHYEATLAMTQEVMDKLNVGLRQNRSFENSWADALGTVWTKGKPLMDAADESPLYAIPEPVARRIAAIARLEGPVDKFFRVDHPLWDNVMDVVRAGWLAAPRFVINNIGGNAWLSTLAGTDPTDFVRAALPKYRKLLNVPEVRMGYFSSEGALEIRTRGSDDIAGNVLNNIRQDGILKAYGTQFQKWGAAVDDYFRRAAAIHRARELTPKGVRSSADYLKEMSRLKELGIQGGIMDEMIGRLEYVKGNPELFGEMVKHVNTFFFDYAGLPPVERVLVRRFLPFWNWTKNVHRLAYSFPTAHPVRAMMLSHLAQVASDVTGQEDLPKELKGSVEASFLENQRLRGRGFMPFADVAVSPRQINLGTVAPYVDAVKTYGLQWTDEYDRMTDASVVEVYGRIYRVAPDGTTAIEIDRMAPAPHKYFQDFIPAFNMAIESARNVTDSIPDWEYLEGIKEMGREMFGGVDTGKPTRFGYKYPPHEWRNTMSWMMGISTAPSPPAAQGQKKQYFEELAKKQWLKNKRDRAARNLTEEESLFE